MMNKILTISFLSLCCLLLPVLSGCAKKNPDGREDVTGTILLNGKPLEGSAGIFFDPVGGENGAGGRGQIMSGKYNLTGQDGVKPGKYTVRISCTATFDKKTNDFATAETTFEREYSMILVPPEFNTNSKIEFEVVAGKKNVFDYDIVTDYKPTKPQKKAANKPTVEL